jgi:hypothetical protein
MRIWIRNTAFILECADLRFADWNIKETCGFSIFGIIIQIFGFANCGLTKKFACPPLLTALFIRLRRPSWGILSSVVQSQRDILWTV